MLTTLKRKFKKMFREFLVYHHSSLEFRAKLLTLMVSSDMEITRCEEEKLEAIAHAIYKKDKERADLLVDTVKEYHYKIITNNGLDFEDLVHQVNKEVRMMKHFCAKIDAELLKTLTECADKKNEEDRLLQQRILEFLEGLKKEECDS